MKCNRCGNTDKSYFYKGSKGYYCRKCISFKRILLKEDEEPVDYKIDEDAFKYNLKYELTAYQKEAADKTLNCLLDGKDVLLHCVCGAGKTEITVKSISNYLSRNLKVCYAISRKEVVIELGYRFKEIFNKAKVITLYGGHHSELTGDLIICTTHQLFRYHKTFDLLIIDEVDAFPLSGNQTLMNIAMNASKGQIIYSTATVNDFLFNCIEKRNYEEVNLAVRPNLKPLNIPKVIYGLKPFNYLCLVYLLKKINGQCIVFVSSKKLTEVIYKILKHFFKITYVYSDLDKRKENIAAFKNKDYQFILSTTVLERGITIKDVNVIILFDRKKAFDKAAIVQMTGRVGRGLNSKGSSYILSNVFDLNINHALKELNDANKKYELSILR